MGHGLKALVAGAAFFWANSCLATTVTLNEFGSPFAIGPGATLLSQGFAFTMGLDAVGVVQAGGEAQCSPPCPYNGTPYLFIQDSGRYTALTIRREDNSAFSFNSFEGSESFVGERFEADRLAVTGTLAAGGTVTYLFDLDGLNDAEGSSPDFQAFFLPAEFANLISVSINGIGRFYDGPDFWRSDFSVDGLIFDDAFGEANGCYPFSGAGSTGGCYPSPGPFPAPEPGSLALLGLGLAGLGLSRYRKN